VVIAVAIVRMMQVPIDHIVDMVSVRNRLMAAAGAVAMFRSVGRAGVSGGAGRGIGIGDTQPVLVVVIAVRAVEMAVMQVVDVAVVPNGDMAAASAMNMGMRFVSGM
jgi:hypothetical protein